MTMLQRYSYCIFHSVPMIPFCICSLSFFRSFFLWKDVCVSVFQVFIKIFIIIIIIIFCIVCFLLAPSAGAACSFVFVFFPFLLRRAIYFNAYSVRSISTLKTPKEHICLMNKIFFGNLALLLIKFRRKIRRDFSMLATFMSQG